MTLARDMVVRDVRTTIVDVPTVREHKLSQTAVRAQGYVIVRVRLENGAVGIGEAATLGGPRWSEESVEAIRANIDAYLAPALVGQRADAFEAVGVRLDEAAKRNNAAKAALDTALYDAVGQTLGVPASALLGGAVRDRVPVLWTLASGDPVQEAEEAESKLSARLHNRFKVKIGAKAPEADMARLRHLVRALEGRAELVVDVNQAWDETVAGRHLPEMAAMGVSLVEQPVPAWNMEGLARLRARAGGPPLLVDECVFDAHDMMRVAALGGGGCGVAEAGEACLDAGGEAGGGGGAGGGGAVVWRVPTGKLRGGSGAPAGVLHVAGAGMGVRAFRAADPGGGFGDGAAAVRGLPGSPADGARAGRDVGRGGDAPLCPGLVGWVEPTIVRAGR